jgi:methylmalonyl-CoA mutase
LTFTAGFNKKLAGLCTLFFAIAAIILAVITWSRMYMQMGKLIRANGEKISFLRNRTASYFKLRGRRPRILITRISPNGLERTVKSVAANFADIGFDVDINLSIQSPAAVARIAVENDVHAVGLPCVSSESEPFVSELLTSLRAECGQSILVVAWMSPQLEDFSKFLKPGIGNFKIFGPGTGYNDSASQILDNLE